MFGRGSGETLILDDKEGGGVGKNISSLSRRRRNPRRLDVHFIAERGEKGGDGAEFHILPAGELARDERLVASEPPRQLGACDRAELALPRESGRQFARDIGDEAGINALPLGI